MLAPPLDFTPTEDFPIEKHRPAGFIVHPGEKIPDRPSDFFLWQVWRNGDLVIVPRYDDAEFAATGVGVNTHEAAVLLGQQEYGHDMSGKVVASGEERTAFGQTWFENNKSGKWQGDAATLKLAGRVKADRGVRTTPWTEHYVVDRSKNEDKGHQKADRRYDQWQLEMRQQVLSLPEGPALVDLYERFGRVLLPHAVGYQIMPDDTRVPRIGDARDLALFLTTLLRRTPERSLLASPQYVLVHASSFDGIYYALQSQLHLISIGTTAPELYEKYVMPPIIDRILEKLTALTEVERDQLEQIKAGFAALPHRDRLSSAGTVLTHLEKPELVYDPPPIVEH